MKLRAPSLKRGLHPALKQHAGAIKAAHAHLSANHPTFASLKPHQQFRMTQAHVRGLKGTK